ncbi:translation initiation factor IF-2-like [Oryx dammah]|uniref:translation initiation factor IF-2-like n=1 Tax=Oryx dammah TaxID=59534 RepID=UPI001A9ABB50|nr:translation initiation factor IF-2-like [Oryx dammah]
MEGQQARGQEDEAHRGPRGEPTSSEQEPSCTGSGQVLGTYTGRRPQGPPPSGQAARKPVLLSGADGSCLLLPGVPRQHRDREVVSRHGDPLPNGLDSAARTCVPSRGCGSAALAEGMASVGGSTGPRGCPALLRAPALGRGGAETRPAGQPDCAPGRQLRTRLSCPSYPAFSWNTAEGEGDGTGKQLRPALPPPARPCRPQPGPQLQNLCGAAACSLQQSRQGQVGSPPHSSSQHLPNPQEGGATTPAAHLASARGHLPTGHPHESAELKRGAGQGEAGTLLATSGPTRCPGQPRWRAHPGQDSGKLVGQGAPGVSPPGAPRRPQIRTTELVLSSGACGSLAAARGGLHINGIGSAQL